mmetsp:Transcript_24104/g.81273  ORF Transcript_24104/g.81273 Transcript_24104/m.81273 type:complete len:212 (+) Transcript_24104:806-1441(+)
MSPSMSCGSSGSSMSGPPPLAPAHSARTATCTKATVAFATSRALSRRRSSAVSRSGGSCGASAARCSKQTLESATMAADRMCGVRAPRAPTRILGSSLPPPCCAACIAQRTAMASSVANAAARALAFASLRQSTTSPTRGTTTSATASAADASAAPMRPQSTRSRRSRQATWHDCSDPSVSEVSTLARPLCAGERSQRSRAGSEQSASTSL